MILIRDATEENVTLNAFDCWAFHDNVNFYLDYILTDFCSKIVFISISIFLCVFWWLEFHYLHQFRCTCENTLNISASVMFTAPVSWWAISSIAWDFSLLITLLRSLVSRHDLIFLVGLLDIWIYCLWCWFNMSFKNAPWYHRVIDIFDVYLTFDWYLPSCTLY